MASKFEDKCDYEVVNDLIRCSECETPCILSATFTELQRAKNRTDLTIPNQTAIFTPHNKNSPTAAFSPKFLAWYCFGYHVARISIRRSMASFDRVWKSIKANEIRKNCWRKAVQ